MVHTQPHSKNKKKTLSFTQFETIRCTLIAVPWGLRVGEAKKGQIERDIVDCVLSLETT